MRMILAEREARTRAFMWAWEQLQGWGDTPPGGSFKKWSLDERRKAARGLACFAIYAPIYGDLPDEAQKIRKRWPAIEETLNG